MKLIAIMPCRNESWILGLSARAVLKWADELVILDHCSTDDSVKILFEVSREHPGRVSVITEVDPEWQEMRHRQRLLDAARHFNATHIAIVDADEVLSGNLLPSIRHLISATPGGADFQLPWLCLRGSIHNQHASGVWAEQHVSMAFVDDPVYHWTAREGYDFHHRQPCGPAMRPYRPVRHGGLMHLQFVSDRRLRAKQALYKCTEVLRWPGREPVRAVDERYNLAVYGAYRKSDAAHDLAPVPPEWWHWHEDLMQYLDIDAEPWQEREVKRLWAEHGAEKFAGLDLFGVVG